jgi:hypothetical protein
MSFLIRQWFKLRKPLQGPKGPNAKSFAINIPTLKPDHCSHSKDNLLSVCWKCISFLTNFTVTFTESLHLAWTLMLVGRTEIIFKAIFLVIVLVISLSFHSDYWKISNHQGGLVSLSTYFTGHPLFSNGSPLVSQNPHPPNTPRVFSKAFSLKKFNSSAWKFCCLSISHGRDVSYKLTKLRTENSVQYLKSAK